MFFNKIVISGKIVYLQVMSKVFRVVSAKWVCTGCGFLMSVIVTQSKKSLQYTFEDTWFPTRGYMPMIGRYLKVYMRAWEEPQNGNKHWRVGKGSRNTNCCGIANETKMDTSRLGDLALAGNHWISPQKMSILVSTNTICLSLISSTTSLQRYQRVKLG